SARAAAWNPEPASSKVEGRGRVGPSLYLHRGPEDRSMRDGENGTRASGTTTPYTPIEDYALIGDSRSAALVSKAGSIDWLCWPRFDSPAIFAALLGPETGGRCLVRPAGDFRSTRRYRDSSNVLETTFETSSGTAALTDLFYAAAETKKGRRLLPQATSIRRLECRAGTVAIDIEVEPRTDFGRDSPRLQRRGPGSWL